MLSQYLLVVIDCCILNLENLKIDYNLKYFISVEVYETKSLFFHGSGLIFYLVGLSYLMNF